jgi:DNA-binding GntR family transcriptional regulator
MSHYPDELTLSRHTVMTAVINRLRRLILTRQLKPGDRLVQDELASRLGVSRTPIREALQQLASEGLVSISAYKGASVAAFAPDDIEAIYHVRIALEGYAARLVAANISHREIERLQSILEEMKRAFREGEPEELLEVNRRFYVNLYRAIRQQRLYDLIINHLNLSRQYRQLYFYLDDLAANTIDEHEKLLQAVSQGDRDAAEMLVKTGLEATVEGLIRSLQAIENQSQSDSGSKTAETRKKGGDMDKASR